jgi:hypothetical protein
MYLRGRFLATRLRTDLSGRRALELAADIQEVAPRHGARRQPTIHMGLEFAMGARREAAQAGGGSLPEERRGMAAEVHRIIRRRNNPGTEGFRMNISVHNIFGEAANRSMYSTNPSLNRYPLIDRLPHALYHGLSQRYNARIGAPLTL